MRNDVDLVAAAVRDACEQEVEPDGMGFDAGSVEATPIAEEADYRGVRVRLVGKLGKARVSVQVDVGFGDKVFPATSPAAYPTILGFPAPRLNGYSRESTIAEKLHAMVRLGALNSRMKDFFDVYALAQGFEFSGEILSEAVRATFERRETPLPSEMPLALTDAFAGDAAKRTQ